MEQKKKNSQKIVNTKVSSLKRKNVAHMPYEKENLEENPN
jgi:hypothetical protein